MANAAIDARPVVLEGETIRIEPLEVRHADSLAKHFELSLFDYFGSVRPLTDDKAGLVGYIEAVQRLANVIPFAYVLQSTGDVVGATSYMDIRAEHRGLEIGMSWIVRPFQGTKVNPEAKYLLLRHAFEVLGCERVQLKCDARNKQSQAAILKLGAQFEGTLRRHFVLPDGYVRDTMMYSVIPTEWPAVKTNLETRL